MLQISDSDLVRKAVTTAPVSRSVVSRYVAGESVPEAVDVVAQLRTTNRLATVDYLGEDVTDRTQAEHTRDTYVALLNALAAADLSAYGAAEVRTEQMPRRLRGFACDIRYWRNADGDIYASRHVCRRGTVRIRFYGMV